MLSTVFKPFVEKSPISVMARGMLERILNPDQLDQWFNATANEQYTKDLLFSTVFELMSQAVQGSQRSIHAAFHASIEDIQDTASLGSSIDTFCMIWSCVPAKFEGHFQFCSWIFFFGTVQMIKKLCKSSIRCRPGSTMNAYIQPPVFRVG